MSETYDLVVIGGGPGGYTAALKSCRLGLNVALVEKERVGGVCLNRGCIPTKALLSDAEGLLWTQRAERDGIIDRLPAARFSNMRKRKDAVVEKIVTNLEKLLAGTGMTLLHDTATIREPGVVTTASGKTLETRSIVVATGSRPWIPPIPGADLPGVLGTREVLDLEKLPRELVIIGGGVIGQEFAALFGILGCRVTVLEVLDRILFEVDAEIARRYASLLPGRGIVTELGVTIHRIERSSDGLRVIYEKKAKERMVPCDYVLVAAGRRPAFSGIGIEDLGMRISHGSIEVNEYLCSSIEGIFAVGDVVNRKMLAHVASYHGEIVAENIAGRSTPVQDEIVPSCVFTIPQIAWVGLTQEQARKAGKAYRTSVFSLAASGKALAMGEPKGLMKLIEDTQTGKLLGAHFMGPQVSELMGEVTLAISKGMSASDIAAAIHPHPTISETVRECALGFLDGPIHAAQRTRTFS